MGQKINPATGRPYLKSSVGRTCSECGLGTCVRDLPRDTPQHIRDLYRIYPYLSTCYLGMKQNKEATGYDYYEVREAAANEKCDNAMHHLKAIAPYADALNNIDAMHGETKRALQVAMIDALTYLQSVGIYCGPHTPAIEAAIEKKATPVAEPPIPAFIPIDPKVHFVHLIILGVCALAVCMAFDLPIFYTIPTVVIGKYIMNAWEAVRKKRSCK